MPKEDLPSAAEPPADHENVDENVDKAKKRRVSLAPFKRHLACEKNPEWRNAAKKDRKAGGKRETRWCACGGREGRREVERDGSGEGVFLSI